MWISLKKSLKMNSEKAHKIGVAAYYCCSMQRKRYGMHYKLIFGSEFWDISPLTQSLHYQLLQTKLHVQARIWYLSWVQSKEEMLNSKKEMLQE